MQKLIILKGWKSLIQSVENHISDVWKMSNAMVESINDSLLESNLIYNCLGYSLLDIESLHGNWLEQGDEFTNTVNQLSKIDLKSNWNFLVKPMLIGWFWNCSLITIIRCWHYNVKWYLVVRHRSSLILLLSWWCSLIFKNHGKSGYSSMGPPLKIKWVNIEDMSWSKNHIIYLPFWKCVYILFSMYQVSM